MNHRLPFDFKIARLVFIIILILTKTRIFAMELSSPAFPNHGAIPSKYTCEGENISPELKWSEIPEKTQSLALILDDPDAPAGNWTHWVLYNIPVNIDTLEENANLKVNGIDSGINSWAKKEYGGPCPPSGEHRYVFRLFALDIKLNPKKSLNSESLQSIMEGHTLAKATLVGRHQKTEVAK
jgi:hypothetical protein